MWFFEVEPFVPRANDLPDWMVVQAIISYLVIGLSYYAIPLQLYFLCAAKTRRSWMSKLFAACILCCASTHLIDVIIYYYPVYRLYVFLGSITAIFALVSAIMMRKVAKQIATLATAEELAEANVKLQAEIETRKKNEEVVKTANEDLESEVKRLQRHIEMQGWIGEKNADLDRLRNTISDLRKTYDGPS